jgi:hypothetical protein
LTSHEVVVATIASTRTHTGLQVGAELDTGSYPLGLAVSREQLRALPIQPHAQRGTWNYTIKPAHVGEPHGGTAGVFRADDRALARTAGLAVLADERLTGMNAAELDQLAALLAPAQAAQTAQRRYEQRGGQRRRAPGAGSTALLTDADRVLITVVYLRQICSQNVLSELLGINTNSIGAAIAETRQLLSEHGRTITPTTLRFATAAALTEFVSHGDDNDPGPTRPRLPALLSAPDLTGMSRSELNALIERVAHTQAARTERHRHRRRGGERLPGARGGVFTQKITDAERVLATVLYQRNLCTQDTLAELFHVSRRTIGNVVREVGPILTQHGHVPTPATTQYATAAAILEAVQPTDPAITTPAS